MTETVQWGVIVELLDGTTSQSGPFSSREAAETFANHAALTSIRSASLSLWEAVAAPPYSVRVFFDDRTGGEVWGPLATREAAERVVVSLATRPDVLRAEIEEVTQ